jgi:hypothetical protein
MTATSTDRTSVPVYIIDRDNGDGRLIRRYALSPLGEACVHHVNDLGLVTHDDLDGGFAGHLTAPAGTTAEATGNGDDAIFQLGSRVGVPLGDAVRWAKGRNDLGLGWSPAK